MTSANKQILVASLLLYKLVAEGCEQYCIYITMDERIGTFYITVPDCNGGCYVTANWRNIAHFFTIHGRNIACYVTVHEEA